MADAEFDQAVDGSQQLVVETIVDEKNPQKLMPALAGLAFRKGCRRLPSGAGGEARRARRRDQARAAFPPQAFDQMETWAAAFMLLGNQFKDIGLKGDEGVESVLRDNFTGQGKPVGELETNSSSSASSTSCPKTPSAQLLEGAIDRPANMQRANSTQMLEAWARGDVNAIARSFNRDLAARPSFEQALIKRRNANWSRWIEQRMAQPGSGLGRGRRRPSRRQGLGDRDAPEATAIKVRRLQ